MCPPRGRAGAGARVDGVERPEPVDARHLLDALERPCRGTGRSARSRRWPRPGRGRRPATNARRPRRTARVADVGRHAPAPQLGGQRLERAVARHEAERGAAGGQRARRGRARSRARRRSPGRACPAPIRMRARAYGSYDGPWPTATVAEEEYLQTIFWLQEAGLPMTGANVARAMQLSRADRARDGRAPGARRLHHARRATRRSRFTAEGLEHAEEIVRRHRLIERFLTDVLGIPWDDVHEEAERLEHAMSPVLEARMLAAIGDAKTCPHGHPSSPGTRIAGVPLGRRRDRREGQGPALRERGRGPPAPVQGRRAWSPARGHGGRLDDDEVASTSAAPPRRSRARWPRPSPCSPTPLRRRAPPSRAARARQGPYGRRRFGAPRAGGPRGRA